MRLLQHGSPMMDISPTPLLIGILFFSISISWLQRSGFPEISELYFALAAASFALYPFYLQAVSYKFDVLLIFSSISLIFAATALGNGTVVSWLVGTAMLILSLGSYQTNISIFPMLVVAKLMHDALSSRDALLRGVWLSAFQLLAAFIVYSVIVEYLIGGQAATRGGLLNPLSGFFFPTVVENASLLMSFSDSFLQDIKISYILIVLSFFSFLVGGAVFFRNYADERGIEFYVVLGVLISGPLLLTVFFLAPLSMLEFPRFRARTILPLSCVFFVMSLSLYYVTFFRIIGATLLVATILVCINLSFLFGGLRVAQDRHDFEIVRTIQNDIDTLGLGWDDLKVHFLGRGPHRRHVERALEERPSLARIMPSNFGNFSYSYNYLRLNGIPVSGGAPSFSDADLTDRVREVGCLPRIEHREFASIAYDGILIIDFTKRVCESE